MFSQYPSDPIQNNPFENPTILAWLLRNCMSPVDFMDYGYEFELDIGPIIAIGSGPFEAEALTELMQSHSRLLGYIELWDEGDFIEGFDIIVVGRENCDLEILDQQIRFRQGGVCKIYSQEMLIGYVLTGSDPFDASKDLLLAFAQGHPVLEYLLYEYDTGYFDWPRMQVSPGEESDFDAELSKEGMLGAMGYHVGKRGKPVEERRRLLQQLYELPISQLPRIQNIESLNKFLASSPRSSERLRLIAWNIQINWLKFIRNDSVKFHQSIKDYESDLKWLKEEFYDRYSYRFDWPDTHVY